MTSRSLRRALFGASLLASVATPAAAQRVDSITAFGDSYADDGNALELGLIPPALQPLYPTGRFTGGANYVDALGQMLNVPIDNFAIGGARANPDFLFEVNSFLTGGGGVFPTVDGSFDEGDLVTVSIGGNDARAYGSTPGASIAGASAAAAPAIGAASAGLDALVAAGAPTISFLAGDTGRLPEVAGSPAVAAIRTAYSTAFNQGIQQALAGYAADGVMVHYLDLSLVLDQVIANPAAYGLTGITCPAFAAGNFTCVQTAGQGFLFYGDLLHPTTQGSVIIARYVAAQLTAPLVFGAPSEVALDNARQFGRTLSGRMDFGSPRDGDMLPGLKLFAAGDLYSRSIGATATNDDFDIAGPGVTAGIQYATGNALIGLAGRYSRPDANFGNDAADVDSESIQLGAFAAYALGPVFAQAYAGYGWDNHDISRRGVVEGISAETDGDHWVAGAKAGYLMLVGGLLRMGPVVGVDYAKARVDGYTEDGDPALTLDVGSISHDSLRGSAGLEVRGDFAPGGMQLRPYGSLVLEKELSGGDRDIQFAQTSAPGIVNRFEYDGSTRAYGRFTGGASAALGTGLTLDAGVSLTAGKRQGNETSGHVGLRLAL